MPGHAAGDWMDGVLDVHPAPLEHVGQLARCVLRLRDRQAVAGDDDHALRVGEQGAEVLGRGRAHAAALRSAAGGGGAGVDLPKRPEQDVAQRASHGVAHQFGQQRARRADKGARDDEGEVVEGEPAGGDGKAGTGVEQRDDHRHVGAADGEHESDAKDQRQDHQGNERERNGGDCEHGDGEADDRGREEQVDDLLPSVGDRRSGHQLLQLRERDHAAREGDRADDDAEHARKRQR